ncbi:MAG: thioredoxin domain-containing protein [bacterium]|nr:thioredoxin domain-containing protein [bacterium]
MSKCSRTGILSVALTYVTLVGCATNEATRFPNWFGAKSAEKEETTFADSGETEAAPENGEQVAYAYQPRPGKTETADSDVSFDPNAMTQLASAISVPPRPALLTLGRDQDLQTLIAEAPGTVLLDFYADWCGPCQKQGKILHDLESTAAAHGATMIKINVDEHPDLKTQFGVGPIPHLVLIQNGRVATRKTGLASRNQLVSWLSN